VSREAEPLKTRARSDSRGRSQSLYMFQTLFKEEDRTPEHTSSLYSNVITASGRRPSMCATVPKLGHSNRLSRCIVAVVTGALADVALLSVLLRFTENKSNDIFCLIPKDYETFDSLVLLALNSYRKQTDTLSNVSNNVVESISTDYSGLMTSSVNHEMDYFLCGFVEPVRGDSIPPQMVSSSLDQVTGLDDSDEETANLEGIPRRYIGTHLRHPEMGEIGYRFFKAALHKPCKMLLVHHDSGLTGRHLSDSAGVVNDSDHAVNEVPSFAVKKLEFESGELSEV